MRRETQRSRLQAGGLILEFAILVTLQGCQPAEPAVRLRVRNQRATQRTCGEECLYLCMASAGGTAVPLGEIEKKIRVGPRGVSLQQLLDVAESTGTRVNGVKTDLDRLARSGVPAVLHVNGDHFVSLLGEESGRLVLFDNRIGLFDCTHAWFWEHYAWDGSALVFGDMPSGWSEAAQSWLLTVVLVVALVGLVSYRVLWRLLLARRRSET